ncbi:sugar transferase [Mycobacterium sp. 1274761.0]|uniref:sugar transferase n=1 Tax=Mycobacterium sp. 1274761.0 TaxID=1834077 RepID=UPI0007FEA261|nr:polyprenyl glycosylphosphotransferase [Mycobacterium sp. 1274761.0]
MVIQQGQRAFIEAPDDALASHRAELAVVASHAVEANEAPVRRLNWVRRYTNWLRITDTAVVAVAVLLAQYVRFGSTPAAAGHYETVYSAVLAAIWLAALAGMRTRSPKYIGAGIEEYRRVVAASFWTFGAVAIAELLMKLEVSRGYLAVALPVGIVGLVLSRWQWRGYVVRQRRMGSCQTTVLAIGDRNAVVNLADELTSSPDYGYRVVGIAIPGYGPPREEHLTINDRQIPVIGGEGHVLEAIRSRGVDKVAIAGTDHFGVTGIRRLMWELEPMGVELVVSPGVMDVARSRLVMRPIAGLPLLYIDKPQYHGAKRFEKRAFDFTFAVAALTASLPLLLIAALAIKITSKGPIFYRAERIGMDGRPFMMFKFRTMVEDADRELATLLSANESDGLLFKMKNDPRVTPVGRVLRRFSVDELPQFINVLRREMSVVGPRPPLRREVEAYDDDVQRRLLVKPGVTGLWQVSGRSDLPWDKSVRLDLSYVDNWSMVGDILIIAKTLRAVVERRGAY